jgi:CDP-6-deoxy-D-xylo-4-hexulose-3-dehydrase
VISVCMPVNGIRRLKMFREAIESVCAQSYTQWEIIISDGDGSARSAVPDDTRIHYFHEKDSGIFSGLNNAIKRASGDILCFLADDDKFAANAFETVVANLPLSHPSWLYGAVEYIDQVGGLIGTKVANDKYTYDQMSKSNSLAAPAIFWNRAMRNSAGDFDEQFKLADYDLWLRFWRVVEPVFVNKTLGYYRMWVGSYSSDTVERTDGDAADVRQGKQEDRTKVNQTYRIPLNACTYGEEEIEAVTDVMKSTYVTMGKHCRSFEIEFSHKLGCKEAILVNSGSSANLLAWFALANPDYQTWKPGWEVIVPAVGWATTYWPIIQAGGTPVIVDSNPDTLQMDIDAMRRALTDKTTAVCPVHVLGNAVDMVDVRRFANSNGLITVEDTCEALGTRYDGRAVGTFGKVGTYSFFFSHHMTSIEGGMVVTDDGRLADIMRMMRAHGWSRDSAVREIFESQYRDLDPRFLFVTSGFNLRSTELNAVIGRIQLQKLDRFNNRRMEIAAFWDREFAGLSGVFQPMRPTSLATNVARFGYPVICESTEIRQRLKQYLTDFGIETRPIVGANIARHPALKNMRHRISGSLDGANRITDCGLLWGLHPMLTDDDVNYVADTIKRFK